MVTSTSTNLILTVHVIYQSGWKKTLHLRTINYSTFIWLYLSCCQHIDQREARSGSYQNRRKGYLREKKKKNWEHGDMFNTIWHDRKVTPVSENQFFKYSHKLRILPSCSGMLYVARDNTAVLNFTLFIDSFIIGLIRFSIAVSRSQIDDDWFINYCVLVSMGITTK